MGNLIGINKRELRRLLDAGADAKIWPSQFGFRRGRGTEDALHRARRAIERAWADRGGRVHLLALDWAKAFDSISPEALITSLRMFGVPCHFVNVISAVYADRWFFLEECGQQSATYKQASGVCQGCPLSPFVFIIVMTVVMQDAVQLLGSNAKQAVAKNQLYDLVYADDTIIIGTDTTNVEELSAAIELVGASCGMSLHWGKVQALSVCIPAQLHKPNGNVFEERDKMDYFGGILCRDGRCDSELSRKIGTAAGDFRKLRTVWAHSGNSIKKKLWYFHSLIISRLLYGLATVCLVTVQRRRLDGFYARCLRKILKIPAAFISRVSNAKVFAEAGVCPLSDKLTQKQLQLLGKVALSPAGSPLRRDTFADGSLIPQIGCYVRRRGRPRQDWTSSVLNQGRRLFGHSRLNELLTDTSEGALQRWNQKCKDL